MSTASTTRKKILTLVQFSLLLAIEAIFCFTPLGSLPALGPIVATLMSVPVVVTAILMGVGAGAAMGAFSGLFSFIVWTFAPPLPIIAFLFTPAYSFGEVRGNFFSLVICFVPRILVGVVAALVYKVIAAARKKQGKSEIIAYAIGGAAGSLTTTIGVLGGVYLFFGEAYAGAIATAYNVILLVLGGQVLTSGVPEAVICALVCVAVCGPVKKIMNRAA